MIIILQFDSYCNTINCYQTIAWLSACMTVGVKCSPSPVCLTHPTPFLPRNDLSRVWAKRERRKRVNGGRKY